MLTKHYSSFCGGKNVRHLNASCKILIFHCSTQKYVMKLLVRLQTCEQGLNCSAKVFWWLNCNAFNTSIGEVLNEKKGIELNFNLCFYTKLRIVKEILFFILICDDEIWTIFIRMSEQSFEQNKQRKQSYARLRKLNSGKFVNLKQIRQLSLILKLFELQIRNFCGKDCKQNLCLNQRAIFFSSCVRKISW